VVRVGRDKKRWGTYIDKNREVEQIPLAEFDHDKKAILEPSMLVRGKSPSEYCVMPIFGQVMRDLRDEGRLEVIHEITLPAPSFEVYRLEFEGKTLVVVNPGMGAALAGGTFDELVALGCRKFVACGTAGVLKPELKRGAVIIPRSAVRDEGTSYHYCPPTREIEMDEAVVGKLEAVLKKHSIDYEIGKTWTTDGIFRETRGKVERRAREGCIAVDMECSAFIAVARFRNVAFGQYLAAGDDVSGEEWDMRYVDNAQSYHEKVFWLSVEACLTL
jgi:uridine phosphorylase